ncbi:MAG: aminomethyl-transferring glycine dehydrogenase subunit GcvPA [candidate division WOR-3 bacterium]
MNFTPHTPEDKRLMLEKIGVRSIEELFDTIPDDLKLKRELQLPPPLSEPEAIRELNHLAQLNTTTDKLTCFAGAGAYDHYRPQIIDAIISRPEFYTAYTPYQAEVSQGTLQSIYEFQSLVCRLLEMEVANASMYDCASALAETVHMARDITGRQKVLISETVNPVYREVVATYAHGLNVPITTLKSIDFLTDIKGLKDTVNSQTAAIIVQEPNFFGYLEPMSEIARICHDAGALLIVAVDPISLGIINPPGSYDADIAVAEGQSLGIPLSFGGPYLGILTAKRKYIRNMPGRIAARTVDMNGQTGYVLALQTREQHIRRERATSNICTNQALCALAAAVYLAWMGREGIKEVAKQCLAKSHYLADRIALINNFKVYADNRFFKEFVVETPVPAREIINAGVKHNILAGVDLGRFNPNWQKLLLIAVTEKRTKAELDRFVQFLQEFQS